MLLGHYPLTWVKHPEYLSVVYRGGDADHPDRTADANLLQTMFLVLDAVGLQWPLP